MSNQWPSSNPAEMWAKMMTAWMKAVTPGMPGMPGRPRSQAEPHDDRGRGTGSDMPGMPDMMDPWSMMMAYYGPWMNAYMMSMSGLAKWASLYGAPWIGDLIPSSPISYPPPWMRPEPAAEPEWTEVVDVPVVRAQVEAKPPSEDV